MSPCPPKRGNSNPGEVQAYREHWDALLEPTAARPYALPDWVATYAAELGLPPGHPDAVIFSAPATHATPGQTVDADTFSEVDTGS